MGDNFKTLASFSGEHLYKIKNSKFFSYGYPVTSVEEIKEHIIQIKKKHYQARHWCYAWRLGTDPIQYRANDDGEPANTAGQPILGQLQSFDVTNTLIIGVRYFGGVKLGVGGLISAYRNSALECLENSEIVIQLITDTTELRFEYPLMNEVMRKVKQHDITISNQIFEINCIIWIQTVKSKTSYIKDIFKNIYGVSVIEEE